MAKSNYILSKLKPPILKQVFLISVHDFINMELLSPKFSVLISAGKDEVNNQLLPSLQVTFKIWSRS